MSTALATTAMADGDGLPAAVQGAVEALAGAVEQVVTVDLDPLDETQLRRLLGAAQATIDRLTGLRTKAAGALESRALRAATPGREQQALRVVRDRTADELRLTPTQVKQAGETGRRLAEAPAAQRAMIAGRLPADHARVLTDTLRYLSGPHRERAETLLLDAAEAEDARTFGRRCRRLLAETDGEAAQLAQDRRNARRGLRMVDTPDGMLALHGQGSGWDAEVVATALHAFARPGGAGRDTRAAEQRTWDALVTVCQTALDTGTAPTNRGVRPHVLITIPYHVIARTVEDGARHDASGAGGRDDGSAARDSDVPARHDAGGVVETAWTGPLPWTEVRRHLVDAGVSRLLVDADGLPLEAGEAVRTVPTGLWKALQVRDRTCIAPGCSVPAAWCQVMHLDHPYRYRGRLSLVNAAAGCSHHHRLYDRHGWQVTWHDGRPVLHHPERSPRPPPSPDHGPAPPRAGPEPVTRRTDEPVENGPDP